MRIEILTAGSGLPVDRAKEVAEAAAPACCAIRVQGMLNTVLGSGFQIPQGFVTTAKHVVEDFLLEDTAELAPWVSIKIIPLSNTGKTYQTTLERIVENYDLAFLREIPELHTLQLGEADKLAIGDPVLVLSAPNTVEEPLLPYAGLGQVHALSTTTPGTFRYTIPVQPGSSGGAVLNIRGEVVGMNVIMQTIGNQVYGVGLKAEAIKAALEGRLYVPSPVSIMGTHILLPLAVGIGGGLLIVALTRR